MRHRRAQIHLPPLQPNDALVLVNLLDKAIAAVWRAHGEQMAELLTAPDVQAPPVNDQPCLPGISINDDLV